jgi:hypothetical protein
MADNLEHHKHHDPTNFGMVSSPHGPETGDDHDHLPAHFPAKGASKEEEAAIFNPILYPTDLYTPEGVYWADLPFGQQMKFNTAVDNTEAKKELGTLWAMIKEDPLSPISWYFKNAVLPGAGLGLEGYVFPQWNAYQQLTFSKDTFFSPLVT